MIQFSFVFAQKLFHKVEMHLGENFCKQEEKTSCEFDKVRKLSKICLYWNVFYMIVFIQFASALTSNTNNSRANKELPKN